MNELFAQVANVPEVSVNWLAIVVATAAAMVIGWVWYGPLYGKKWMKLVGLNKKDVESGSWTPIYVMLVLAILQAFLLSHFIVYTSYFYPDMSGVVVGLITGFWIWLGFSAVAAVSSNMFSQRSIELTKIEAGNSLVTILVMGAIIGAWL